MVHYSPPEAIHVSAKMNFSEEIKEYYFKFIL